MNFARWETKENMKKFVPLIQVDGTREIEKSGLPMAYDDENLYIDSRFGHSLIIGSTGSGKTQTITLPMLEIASISGESVIVEDATNELYEETKDNFISKGYNVFRLNFDNALKSNHYNPFELPYNIYKMGNKDKAQELIEDLAFYLLNDTEEKDNDTFWINSAIDYFTGITLYAFENESNIDLNKIFEIDLQIRNNSVEFLKNVDKRSNIYINLRGVLEAPNETRGSIFSVFNQKIKRYIAKDKLIELMKNSDFDITSLGKDKTIIYIASGNSNNGARLLPLLISQVYFAKDYYAKKEGRLSIILDNFFDLYPIRNFGKMLNYSRSIGIMFTVMVRGFNDFRNIYGKEQTEIIKLCFVNLVYLLSQDPTTLEEISDLCGNISIDSNKKIPLISVEELKVLQIFEAVIITPRIMPFKTKLLPYYKIKELSN